MGFRKKLILALSASLLIVVIVILGAGWYLSNLIRDGGLVPEQDEPEYTLEVTAISEESVTLRVTSETDEDGDWRREGLFGLEWEDGYAQAGGILDLSDEQVVREVFAPRTPPDSRPPILTSPPSTGTMVRLDGFAFTGNPQEALGLIFEEVEFTSPLGRFPAWFIAGNSDTWAIFVHGKGADREEALRMLPTVVGAGLPSLVITYRNDEGLPLNPDGYYRYGLTEWEDLEGAVSYAFDNGATHVVLVGYSMGGGIVASFLYESTLSGRVVAAILDAPMLDFGETVDLGARERGYPGIFATLAKAFSGFRFDVEWGKMDYLKRVDELDVPILLFHGEDDDTVPVETSDALAESRPDIVKYIRMPETRHVRAWNTNRMAYQTAVQEFLKEVLKQ